VPLPPAFELRISPKLVAVFRTEAKRRFPKEAYGVFLGQFEEPGVIEVEGLEICPPKRLLACSQWAVTPENSWLAEVARRAASEDLNIVGDIHSHCAKPGDLYIAETSPSECDLGPPDLLQRIVGGTYSFMAIMALNKTTVKIRSRVSFWPLPPPIQVVWREFR
jgi:proteasome lid subunit RPN8/RPN11